MMDNNFDPYEILVNLQERMNRLEHAHNQLARAFQKTEVDLNVTLNTLRQLQKAQLSQGQVINELIQLQQESLRK